MTRMPLPIAAIAILLCAGHAHAEGANKKTTLASEQEIEDQLKQWEDYGMNLSWNPEDKSVTNRMRQLREKWRRDQAEISVIARKIFEEPIGDPNHPLSAEKYMIEVNKRMREFSRYVRFEEGNYDQLVLDRAGFYGYSVNGGAWHWGNLVPNPRGKALKQYFDNMDQMIENSQAGLHRETGDRTDILKRNTPTSLATQERPKEVVRSDDGAQWKGMGGVKSLADGAQATGNAGVRITCDPVRDLQMWLGDRPYHEDPPVATLDSGPERAVSLVDPDAGPAPANGLYGRLLAFLPSDGAAAPTPVQMLQNLEPLWKARWRTTLGFDADPYSRQLLADADYARKLGAAARKRLDELRRSAGTGSDAAARLKAQMASAQRELDAAQAKEKETSDALFRRLKFVEALVELLRLAPHGGFGPEFDTANLDAVQKSAARILAELGALAGNLAWKGLAEDLAWIEDHDADRNGAGFARRVRGMTACETLLADPRVEGLAAVCDFVAADKPASASLLRKAFELVERLGTDRLRPEVLRTLPRLLEICAAKDFGARERAHMLVLRILKVRGGGVSLEATIGTLAPLTVSKDAELARASLAFLRANTGMDFGAEPRKWQALQAEMKQKRTGAK